eukprot:gnl/TRDRNA2_/TRDRNA2_178100_c1_seq1.p2 gnl/TRDRNA2_/TRDRNA2_178100_c1~~gnl/TRDRNA2_/TRDRNA2_178100_c1_seq1.p2  ORF type:complete len:367 (+),score=-25.34 gnl/TRDRNA2_/TRDRNA2_178100_c1_seq1:70-1170(+)
MNLITYPKIYYPFLPRLMHTLFDTSPESEKSIYISLKNDHKCIYREHTYLYEIFRSDLPAVLKLILELRPLKKNHLDYIFKKHLPFSCQKWSFYLMHSYLFDYAVSKSLEKVRKIIVDNFSNFESIVPHDDTCFKLFITSLCSKMHMSKSEKKDSIYYVIQLYHKIFAKDLKRYFIHLFHTLPISTSKSKLKTITYEDEECREMRINRTLQFLTYFIKYHYGLYNSSIHTKLACLSKKIKLKMKNKMLLITIQNNSTYPFVTVSETLNELEVLRLLTAELCSTVNNIDSKTAKLENIICKKMNKLLPLILTVLHPVDLVSWFQKLFFFTKFSTKIKKIFSSYFAYNILRIFKSNDKICLPFFVRIK